MDLSFKEFMKIMICVIVPVLIYAFAYAILISLIPNNILAIVTFIITIAPMVYSSMKIISKLSNKYID